MQRSGAKSHTQTSPALLILGALIIPIVLLAVLVRVALAQGAAPVVDLNGDASGTSFTASFTEDEGPRSIVAASSLRVTDADSETLASAVARLTNRPDGSLELLAANPGDTGIVVQPFKNGELKLSGSKSVEAYQQVLRTLTYDNASQSPDIADRIIIIEVNDGSNVSQPVTSTVTINAVNDAPVLDNSGNMVLTTIKEDDALSSGDLVEKIIQSAETAGENRITDVDKGAVEGFAVIDVGTSNGVWQYSTTGGASWLPFGVVSNNAAVLLNVAARIRFVPNSQFSGSSSITFRAWDQTQGVNGATGVDVSVSGGTTAFSTATETAIITVSPVNDLPVVDLNGPAAGNDFNTSFLGSGQAVKIASTEARVADPDNPVLKSLTLTMPSRPDGSAEMLAASTLSTSITAVPYNPATGVLQLNGPDTLANFETVLRTVTYNNTAVTPTTGARTVQVVANDGTDSGLPAISTININRDNNAPVLNPEALFTLDNVSEDASDPAGNAVGEIIDSAGEGALTDPDPGALRGIAVTGADGTNGQWQFALSVPVTMPVSWQPIGTVSDTAALLLDEVAVVRFVPSPDYAGPSGALTFRAWDQTGGTSGQSNVDVSVNGGATPYSQETGTASLMVMPVNDRPVLDYTPGAVPLFVEDGTAVSVFNGSLAVRDVDDLQLAGATVTLLERPDGDAEWLQFDSSGTAITGQYTAGVLSLTGAASPAAYQQVLKTVAYRNTSQDPDPSDRLIQVVVGDGRLPSAPLNVSLAVQPVNDAPVVDLNGAGAGNGYLANFYIEWGAVPIVDPNTTVTDVDNTTLVSATIQITNLLDGPAEILNASLSGTNISTKVYDPDTGELRLEGTDSVENYQKVLRTVTYNNTREQPSTEDRIVVFRASDGQAVSDVATSIVSIRPTPTAQIRMPIVSRRSEEPNDRCEQALDVTVLPTDRFMADDTNDWFAFRLEREAVLEVTVRSFANGMGQLLVARGQGGCQNLTLLGHNGDDRPDKTVSLGKRPAGTYYIVTINDGSPGTAEPYDLIITATP